MNQAVTPGAAGWGRGAEGGVWAEVTLLLPVSAQWTVGQQQQQQQRRKWSEVRTENPRQVSPRGENNTVLE